MPCRPHRGLQTFQPGETVMDWTGRTSRAIHLGKERIFAVAEEITQFRGRGAQSEPVASGVTRRTSPAICPKALKRRGRLYQPNRSCCWLPRNP